MTRDLVINTAKTHLSGGSGGKVLFYFSCGCKKFNKQTQVDICVHKLWPLKSQLLTHESHRNIAHVKQKVSYRLKFTDGENFSIHPILGAPILLFMFFIEVELMYNYYMFQVYNRLIHRFLKLYYICS